MRRNFLSFIKTFGIVASMISQGVYAEGMDLDSLLEQYTALVTSRKDIEKITGEQGSALMNEGQSFIKNNPDALKTEKGQQLVAIHNKYTRIKLLKEQLDNCVKGDLNDPKYTNRLPERIFEAALTTPDGEIPCDVKMFEAESLDTLLGSMRDVADSMESEDSADGFDGFQAQMHNQGLANAAKSLIALKYTYDADVGGLDELTDEIADQKVVNEICNEDVYQFARYGGSGTTSNDRCSAEQRSHLRETAKAEFKKHKAIGTTQYSAAAAARSIKERIRTINDVIQGDGTEEKPGLQFDIEEGFFSDSIDYNSEKSQQAHQTYVTAFMEQAKTGPGLLMWTDAIGGEMGTRRDRDESSVFGLIGGGYDPDEKTYKTHDESISERNVKDAIAEAQSRILEQSENLHKKETERKRQAGRRTKSRSWLSRNYNAADIVEARREDLKKMVGLNPMLVGQTLMKDPSKVDEACTVINDIAQESKDNEGWTLGKVAMWGGVIVGGTLLAVATGGLAIAAYGAGAAALGATVTSAGAFALAGATFKGLAVAGFVYGVAETTAYGTQYIKAAQERDELVASFLGGGGDSDTADEFLQALDEAEDAALNAAISAGFTVLDIPGAMAIAKALRAGRGGTKAALTTYWKDIKEASDMIANGTRLKGVINQMIGKFGRKETKMFLQQLMKQKKPNDLLRAIKGMNDAEVEALFKNGIKVCEEMCS